MRLIAHVHSKVDKIVNNFHGQNQFHFHDQSLIFIIKTPIFVVQKNVLMLRSYKFFLGELLSLHSVMRTRFLFQPHSKIYDQSLFRSKSKVYGQPTFHSIGKILLWNPLHSNDEISWSASFHSNGVSDLFQSVFQSSNPIGQYIIRLYALMCHCPNNRVYKMLSR